MMAPFSPGLQASPAGSCLPRSAPEAGWCWEGAIEVEDVEALNAAPWGRCLGDTPPARAAEGTGPQVDRVEA